MTVSADFHVQYVGKYELRESLGCGALCTTWKAFDLQFQSYVAIKILREVWCSDPHIMQRFWGLPLAQEAKNIASLRHSNIVSIHTFDVSLPLTSGTSLPYIVTDFVEGTSLADYLHSTSYQGDFPAATDIIDLFAPLASAIDYAHQQGVIHGDIKPTNILLDRQNTARLSLGEPMLADAGISRLLEISPQLLCQEKPDTARFLSPEQVLGQPANIQSDIYSLGGILYELLTGRQPFCENNWEAFRAQIIDALPPSPHELNPQISPTVSAVILRSLAKSPEERFPSAASLVQALAEVLGVAIPAISSKPAIQEVSAKKRKASDRVPIPASIPDILVEPARPPNFAVQLSTVENGSADAVAPAFDTSRDEEPFREIPITPPAKSIEDPLPFTVSAPWQTSPAREFTSTAFVPTTPDTTHPVTPAVIPISNSKKRGGWPFRKKSHILLVIILLLVLAASILAAIWFLTRGGLGTTGEVQPGGFVSFVSSGEMSVNNNQGIDDQVLVDLHHIPAPSTGKSYFAWLLGDSSQAEASWLPLGQVSVNSGNVHLFYAGDKSHDNLLAGMSRFLLNEVDANTTPSSPILDRSTWRYYGEIPQQTSHNNANHLTLLDYLRSLLVQAPELQAVHVQGGLSTWFDRDVEEISKWALSAKESWETQSISRMRQLLTNILYYLDGSCTQADLQGMPQSMPLLPENLTILRIAGYSLLTPCPQGTAGQSESLKQLFKNTPNDLLDHLLFHLAGLAHASGATASEQTLTTQLNAALFNARSWLDQVRQDALQLGHMNDNQLSQSAALSLLGDLEVQARYAFAGRIDPATGSWQGGSSWIEGTTNSLTTLTISPYSPTGR